MHREAQFVALRRQARRGGMRTIVSAFENDDIDALGGQLARGEGCGESATDEHDGAALQAYSHDTLL
jgi:translation initiation factor 1 (eIF-1/SUI1)